MTPEWICIIPFFGWSSYVISFGLGQYLSFVPYIIEQVPKYLGWRGKPFFSDLWYISADDLISIQIRKVTKFIMGRSCCFWHCVFCHLVCHMWWCVAPNNFQTSTSGSRRFKSKADAPYSSISALLSLHSAVIIFHFSSNSPQTDCCCTIPIISFELSGFLFFWSYTISYNNTLYIWIRITTSTLFKTNSYTNWFN